MPSPSDTLVLSTAVSARAFASLYVTSLLVSLVAALAAVAGWWARREGPEARALVWRSAVVALLIVVLGRQSPLHWVAWVMPSALAMPLVVLGRVQLNVPSAPMTAQVDPSGLANPPVVLAVLMVFYLAGVVAALLPTAVGLFDAWRRTARGRAVASPGWRSVADEARRALGIRRDVKIVISDARVSMTWGIVRPVILLPRVAERWTREQRRMVLLHELAHVRAADWAVSIGARAVCGLLWFHPAVWWLAARFRAACELACDERVLRAGARRSDYAELLVDAADRLLGSAAEGAALALAPAGDGVRENGLRGRLAAVLSGREHRPLGARWPVAALVLTLALAGPMSVVQLAPTRAVLTTLLRDGGWESRAYAVLGLAQRQDSVAMARRAAERDPSPRVRAWARYALQLQARPDAFAAPRDARAAAQDPTTHIR